MASTVEAAHEINVVGGTTLRSDVFGPIRMTVGVGQLAVGTVELDTGLNVVRHFSAICTEDVDTETVAFRVREDFPTALGVITVDGTKVDEGAAVANAGSEIFSWMALGE